MAQQDSSQSVHLTVVLPAYNEEDSIAALLDNVVETLKEIPQSSRIIVVDDGSTDRTAQIVRSYANRGVELVPHEQNRGLHEAVRTGMLCALRDTSADGVVVVMDADNTHHPELIPRMIEEIRKGADVVIASRFAPGGKMVGAPAIRHLYSMGARLLLQLRFPSSGVRDFTCGYRAYRAGILDQAFARWGNEFISMQGFACMLDILLRLHSLGARIVEVPLVLRYDLKVSTSKLRVFRTIKNTLSLAFTRRRSKSSPSNGAFLGQKELTGRGRD